MVGKLSTRIKICGITRWRDAEAAIEYGADALGFVMEPSSPRSVFNFQEALDIPKALGPFIQSVAVYGRFHGEVPSGFNAVQIVEGAPSDLPVPLLHSIRLAGTEIIELPSLTDASGIVLDAYSPDAYGGTGKTVDWDRAAEFVMSTELPVILAGGLNPDNAAEAIETVRPYGVDVSSGVEAMPGTKDLGKLKAFIEAVRSVRLQ